MVYFNIMSLNTMIFGIKILTHLCLRSLIHFKNTPTAQCTRLKSSCFFLPWVPSAAMCPTKRWSHTVYTALTSWCDQMKTQKAEPERLLGICWCAKKAQVHKQQKAKDAGHLLLLKQNNSHPLQVAQLLLRSSSQGNISIDPDKASPSTIHN